MYPCIPHTPSNLLPAAGMGVGAAAFILASSAINSSTSASFSFLNLLSSTMSLSSSRITRRS